MKPEWKQKWIEALRSGKYKQGRCRLRNEQDEFCCLGVLCDIVDSEGWGPLENEGENEQAHHLWQEIGETIPSLSFNDASGENFASMAAPKSYKYLDLDGGSRTTLPPKVTNITGELKNGRVLYWTLNDCERRSFSEIADFIEANE